MLLDRVGEPQQRERALAGRGGGPAGRTPRGRPRRRGRRPRAVEQRRLGDRLAGRRVQDGLGLALGGVDPVPVDEVLQRSDCGGHGAARSLLGVAARITAPSYPTANPRLRASPEGTSPPDERRHRLRRTHRHRLLRPQPQGRAADRAGRHRGHRGPRARGHRARAGRPGRLRQRHPHRARRHVHGARRGHEGGHPEGDARPSPSTGSAARACRRSSPPPSRSRPARPTSVLAGGAESMSRGPYWMPGARWGARMGDATLVDPVMGGLTDPFHEILMGVTAENLAESHSHLPRGAGRVRRRVAPARRRRRRRPGGSTREIVPVDGQGQARDRRLRARRAHPPRRRRSSRWPSSRPSSRTRAAPSPRATRRA